MKDIGGVGFVDSYVYLGIKMSLNRGKMIADAKSRVRGNVGILKSRIKVSDPRIRETIFTSYIRSLIIYQFLGLYITGVITGPQID